MAIEDLVARLGLAAHPEGGWYREVYRDAALSTIHYVLPARGLAPLHRVRDRVELWHFYGGAPVELHTISRWRRARHASSRSGPTRRSRSCRRACGRRRAPATPTAPGAAAPWRRAFDFAAWEMPSRAELLRALPATLHAMVVELTRA